MNPDIKIAFASQAVYPNYCHRIKEHILKSYFECGLSKYNIPYYITTNYINLLSEYNNDSLIKVLDIDTIRSKDSFSIQYELLPEDPTGLYPGKYPWNLHRYSVEQAALDGFNYIIYLDVDNKINQCDQIYENLISSFEKNTVSTNLSIYYAINKFPKETFQYHDEYISNLNFNFDIESMASPDGPVQVFMGETNSNILNLINKWHYLTEYGYTVANGYRNSYISNLSFCIPWAGFSVKYKGFPFTPHHISEDRY